MTIEGSVEELTMNLKSYLHGFFKNVPKDYSMYFFSISHIRPNNSSFPLVPVPNRFLRGLCSYELQLKFLSI